MKVLEGLTEKERFDFFSKEILEDGKIIFAGKILQKASEKFPVNVALIYQDRVITYKELYYMAMLFSKKIIEKGVRPSDRVLLFYRNSLEFYVAYFGAWQAGAVVAPLNIFLRERELNHILKDSDPALIITSTDKVDFFVESGVPIFTQEDMELTCGVPDVLPDFEIKALGPDDLAALLYTSGTTGLPKGVMLSSKNIMTNVAQIFARMPFGQAQRLFCVLPLFHCFAQNTCVWSALFSGSSIVVVPKISRKDIFAGLQHKPTIMLGVPALYGLLCLFKTAPLSSVEYFVSGGDALSDKIRAAFALVYGRKLCNGYGLTETSPLISVDMEDVTESTNTVGRSVVGIECRIKDEHGHVLPQGQIGELWVKGNNIMMGYYNAPEITKNVLVDGWLATGDFAKVDSNEKLVICGRLKDLIIHKGLNIYPQEIENVIVGHQDVLRVGVIGKDDELHGQVPIAVVQLRREREGIEKELRNLCKKELAAYKIPKRFIIVKDMPLTATSKVDKNKVREQVFK